MYIAGTLRKWTNYFNGWQERWFVMDNGILSYYKSQDDVTNGCKGSVKMSVCDIVVHATDQTRLDLIIPGEQHFYVKAANPQERQEWLVALGSAKASMGKLSEESVDATQDLLKSKRSELRLYCDLLMQQIHSVKTAVEEQETPDMEKLNEATSLISPTCDTFINSLNECMRLAQNTSLTFEGQRHVIVDANTPTSPLKSSNKKGKHLNRQNSNDRHSRSPSVSSVEALPVSRQNSHNRTVSDNSDPGMTVHSGQGPRYNESGHVVGHVIGSKTEGKTSQSTKQTVQSYKSDLKSIKETLHLNQTGSTQQSKGDSNVNNSHITSPGSCSETGSNVISPGESTQTDLTNGDLIQSDEEVFLDPMEDRIPTFFSDLDTSFVNLPVYDDGGIPVPPFLDACKCLMPIFDKLNATAFAPVKLDFKGNIQKVHTKYTSNSEGFPTLQSMILHEVSLKQSHLPHSASTALLWMKRSLQFIIGFMDEVYKGEQDLGVAATKSYSQSLKPYHGWVVRGVFAVAVKALPYRETFISLLHSPATAKDSSEVDHNLFITCLYQDILVFNSALKVIVKILEDFFEANGLNVTEQI